MFLVQYDAARLLELWGQVSSGIADWGRTLGGEKGKNVLQGLAFDYASGQLGLGGFFSRDVKDFGGKGGDNPAPASGGVVLFETRKD